MAGLTGDKMGYNKMPAAISLLSLSATTKRKKKITKERTAGLHVCQDLESCCLNPEQECLMVSYI